MIIWIYKKTINDKQKILLLHYPIIEYCLMTMSFIYLNFMLETYLGSLDSKS